MMEAFQTTAPMGAAMLPEMGAGMESGTGMGMGLTSGEARLYLLLVFLVALAIPALAKYVFTSARPGIA